MEKDMEELLDEFCDQNRLHSFEGDSGLERFTKVVEALGYKAHRFKWGTPIEVFLSDNSGAIEAVIEWIGSRNIPEWKENLESNLEEDEEDEVET